MVFTVGFTVSGPSAQMEEIYEKKKRFILNNSMTFSKFKTNTIPIMVQ